MLKTPIKAASVTNLTDARYFAAWEVNWLGFQLSLGSENFVDATQMKAMRAWIEGPIIVGEFGLQSTEDILHACELLELGAVQVGLFAELAELKKTINVPIIQEIIPESLANIAELESHFNTQSAYVDLFLLNFDANGISWADLQQSDSLSLLQEWCQNFEVILSFRNLKVEEVEELSGMLPIAGLQVKGGAEEKTGFKSFDELDELFEAIEVQI